MRLHTGTLSLLWKVSIMIEPFSSLSLLVVGSLLLVAVVAVIWFCVSITTGAERPPRLLVAVLLPPVWYYWLSASGSLCERLRGIIGGGIP